MTFTKTFTDIVEVDIEGTKFKFELVRKKEFETEEAMDDKDNGITVAKNVYFIKADGSKIIAPSRLLSREATTESEIKCVKMQQGSWLIGQTELITAQIKANAALGAQPTPALVAEGSGELALPRAPVVRQAPVETGAKKKTEVELIESVLRDFYKIINAKAEYEKAEKGANTPERRNAQKAKQLGIISGSKAEIQNLLRELKRILISDTSSSFETILTQKFNKKFTEEDLESSELLKIQKELKDAIEPQKIIPKKPIVTGQKTTTPSIATYFKGAEKNPGALIYACGDFSQKSLASYLNAYSASKKHADLMAYISELADNRTNLNNALVYFKKAFGDEHIGTYARVEFTKANSKLSSANNQLKVYLPTLIEDLKTQIASIEEEIVNLRRNPVAQEEKKAAQRVLNNSLFTYITLQISILRELNELTEELKGTLVAELEIILEQSKKITSTYASDDMSEESTTAKRTLKEQTSALKEAKKPIARIEADDPEVGVAAPSVPGRLQPSARPTALPQSSIASQSTPPNMAAVFAAVAGRVPVPVDQDTAPKKPPVVPNTSKPASSQPSTTSQTPNIGGHGLGFMKPQPPTRRSNPSQQPTTSHTSAPQPFTNPMSALTAPKKPQPPARPAPSARSSTSDTTAMPVPRIPHPPARTAAVTESISVDNAEVERAFKIMFEEIQYMIARIREDPTLSSALLYIETLKKDLEASKLNFTKNRDFGTLTKSCDTSITKTETNLKYHFSVIWQRIQKFFINIRNLIAPLNKPSVAGSINASQEYKERRPIADDAQNRGDFTP